MAAGGFSGQAVETAVGALVVAAAVGFALYATQFTGGGSGGDYSLRASFRSAEGIGVGTDIRLSGVSVGSVSGMTLDPETFRADAILSVEGSLQLPEDTAAVVASEGLLGGAFVELLPGGSEVPLQPGDTIADTEGAVSIVSLLLKFVGGGE